MASLLISEIRFVYPLHVELYFSTTLKLKLNNLHIFNFLLVCNSSDALIRMAYSFSIGL
jgi:hypothetical protein